MWTCLPLQTAPTGQSQLTYDWAVSIVSTDDLQVYISTDEYASTEDLQASEYERKYKRRIGLKMKIAVKNPRFNATFNFSSLFFLIELQLHM